MDERNASWCCGVYIENRERQTEMIMKKTGWWVKRMNQDKFF